MNSRLLSPPRPFLLSIRPLAHIPHQDPDRDLAPETYASRVAARRGVYNGFNLVVGRIRRDPGGDTKCRTDFWYVGNRGAARGAPPRRLDPADDTGGDTPETPAADPSEPNRTEPDRTGPDRLGGGVVIGVGNAPLFCATAAEEWPKVAEGEAATRDALAECFAELARGDGERVTAPAREDPPGEVDRGVDDREGDDRDGRGFDALADRLAEALTRRALEHPGGAFASEDAFDPLSDDDDAPAAGGVGVRKTTSEDVRKRRRFLRPGDAGAGSEGYGTRSCSVVVADKRGAWAAYERSAEWRSVDGSREVMGLEGLEGLDGLWGNAADRPLERRGAKRLAWGDVVVHRARLVADDEINS